MSRRSKSGQRLKELQYRGEDDEEKMPYTRDREGEENLNRGEGDEEKKPYEEGREGEEDRQKFDGDEERPN